MDVDQDRLVDALGSALRYGGSALGDVPELLERVLIDGVWRGFTTRRGEEVHHERFADFVTTPPLAGLGSDVELIRRIVADKPELERRLRVVLLEQGRRTDLGNNRTEVRGRTTGTSRAYALDRLSRDAPELHAEVLAGNLSAHAAMVQAGYRPPTFTLRTDSPKSVAAALRRRMNPDQLSELARLLLEG